MYFDSEPCRVCGADVELRARTTEGGARDGPVGPSEGYVGGADATPDERVCTNAECPTHAADQPAP
jgi:hypothetical protein